MDEVPGLRVIRKMGCSVGGTDSATGSIMCWVFPWWTCPREARLFRSWCVCAGPRGGEASSSSSLLWILSKPKDCSTSLDGWNIH